MKRTENKIFSINKFSPVKLRHSSIYSLDVIKNMLTKITTICVKKNYYKLNCKQ